MMIIECPYCESKVDGNIRCEIEDNDPEYPYRLKYVFVECPVCTRPLLGLTEYLQVGMDKWDWDRTLHRVWPQCENVIDREIPNIARLSLVEAKLCFKAKAYSACAVMCGRTIEGVCKHHNTKAKTLAKGLEDLKARDVIDKRLFEWGEELRKHRNIGAHATDEKISKEDAKDLLDFTTAICDYVFVLNAKFGRFKQRNKT